jgi:hypothetical protein
MRLLLLLPPVNPEEQHEVRVCPYATRRGPQGQHLEGTGNASERAIGW